MRAYFQGAATALILAGDVLFGHALIYFNACCKIWWSASIQYMAASRKLASTTRILGLPITRLPPAAARDREGRPLLEIDDRPRLDALLERLAGRVAAGTARTYRPFITAWWSLCERRGAELDDDALLRGWLLAMTSGAHAWSTSSARVAMAAVTALRGLLDIPAPLADHAFSSWFDGDLLLPLAAPPARKAPVLKRHLLDAVRQLTLAAQRPESAVWLTALRDRALILLGFSAAMRRSELVAVSVGDIRKSAAGGWVLHIRRSKTDQRRAGQTVPLYHATDARLDALAALEAWQSAAVIVKGPLFRRIDRHGSVGAHALHPASVGLILGRLHLGDDVSAHSLRRGFITEARLAGASNAQIRKVSRHKTDQMLDTYTADIDAHRQGPGAIV